MFRALVVSAALASTVSCAAGNGKVVLDAAKEYVKDLFIDCGAPAIRKNAEILVPAVNGLLSVEADESTVKAGLDFLALTGKEAAACALAYSGAKLGRNGDGPQVFASLAPLGPYDHASKWLHENHLAPHLP